MNPLTVILQTYGANAERTRYTLMTIDAMRKRARYAGDILWYVADDGSPQAHIDAVLGALDGEKLIGWHSERKGYGYNATKAWYMALQHGDVSLWLEDDWTLLRDTDFTRWVQLLESNESVAMIRLAQLVAGLHAESADFGGYHYLRFFYNRNYTFSGNPALRHRRARELWGAYPEGLKPGDTECAYDAQVRVAMGGHNFPAIIWPIEVGGWGLFGHIGTEKSYD